MTSVNYTGVSQFRSRDMSVVGSGPLYSGYGAPTNPVDGATFGLKIGQNNDFSVENPAITRVALGIDASQVPTWQDGGCIRGGKISHCFRGVYLHDRAEGVFISDINVSDCVFGIVVDSGNSNLANGQSVRCSIGLLISGGTNHGHGSVMGWNSRHNTYNLSVQNVTNGHYFGGCNFTAGQSGADQGKIQILNSKGVLIDGGQTAYSDITVDSTSQLWLRNVTYRGPVNITVSAGGAFDAKNCVVMSGATLTLNGAPFSGNT